MKFHLNVLTHGTRGALMEGAAIAAPSRVGTSCKRGCHHCCSRLVHPSVAEAMVIRDELVKSGSWNSVLNRAKELVSLSMSTTVESWFKMNIKCPVLDPETKDCLAYSVRPIVCSSHFVKSKPSSCDPWSLEPLNYERADSEPALEFFQKKLDKLGHGVLSTRLPMSAALITANKLSDSNNWPVEDVLSAIGRET